MSRNVRLGCLLLLLACTVGCDQVSKHFARTTLSQSGPVIIAGGFAEFNLAENPGSFLSLGALLPEGARFAVYTLGVGVGLVLLSIYLTGRAEHRVVHFAGLSLVLAGGISNLLDRIFHSGLVTDFVIIRIGPLHTGVFNVADMLIMIGIIAAVCSFPRKQVASSEPGQTQ